MFIGRQEEEEPEPWDWGRMSVKMGKISRVLWPPKQSRESILRMREWAVVLEKSSKGKSSFMRTNVGRSQILVGWRGVSIRKD